MKGFRSLALSYIIICSHHHISVVLDVIPPLFLALHIIIFSGGTTHLAICVRGLNQLFVYMIF